MLQLKIKQLELGKTRTKKASPDKFNFYVVLAGLDKVNGLPRDGLPRAGANSKPHDYKKRINTEGPSEDMGFNGKTV